VPLPEPPERANLVAVDFTAAAARLAELGAELARRGLVAGSGGNASVRDGDELLIKGSGARFRDGDPRAFVRVPLDASAPCSSHPSIERPMHAACYRARADVGAVFHAHPPLAIAWATTGERLAAITPDGACHFGAAIPCLPYLPPGSRELADAVGAEIAAGANGVILANHGAVCVGRTIDEAFDRILLLDALISAALFGRLLTPLGVRPLDAAQIAAVRALRRGAR
jgi:L-fuculose-phosphate aldolase